MATLALDYLLQEQIYKTDSNSLISKYSNIGANPIKGPTPKSLFYEAAKRNPGKYGQYLFYSLGSFDNLGLWISLCIFFILRALTLFFNLCYFTCT